MLAMRNDSLGMQLGFIPDRVAADGNAFLLLAPGPAIGLLALRPLLKP
ncbi:MAG TPA: hypothetical protein VHN19_15345 [Burkholderiales bacterium]|jgi:hypothetical protein|nr:hypothetical protein [Burkholderiales bacterium]HEX2651303.1 hypothetical protein [Burkholderiales bacterium]